MWVTWLGFALLLWIPGELLGKCKKPLLLKISEIDVRGYPLNLKFSLYSGQGVEQACSAPSLNHGYCVPAMESYPHEIHIRYACDNGYKPTVEGWWATAMCQNGKWFHEPQCIGKYSLYNNKKEY